MIKTISEEEKEEVQKAWQERTVGREVLHDSCSTERTEEKARWIEMSLTSVMNSLATLLRVTACSKGWWTLEVATKHRVYGRTNCLYKQGRVSRFSMKVTRNFYNYAV